MKALNFALLTILTMLLGMVLSISAVYAQENPSCFERELVIERLATGFKETRQSIGMSEANTIVEIFANRETGTWTLTMTTAEGITCLIGSGEYFEVIEEELTPAGDKL